MDESAFLRAICDEPDDDAVRLVFADWLDEHGQPERAEFIRLQIAVGDGPTTPRLAELIVRRDPSWSPGLPGWLRGTFRRGLIDEVFVIEAQWPRIPASMWEHCPVTVLDVASSGLGWGLLADARMARLRGLRLTGAWVTGRDVARLASADVRRLRSLDLAHYAQADAIDALAASPTFAGLESLNLSRTSPGFRGIRWLARARFAANLRRLDLSGCRLRGRSAFALLSGPFARLECLDLRNNPLGSAASDLRARFGDRVLT